MSAMINQLKHEFNALLTEHDWMDEESSQFLKEKVRSRFELFYLYATLTLCLSEVLPELDQGVIMAF